MEDTCVCCGEIIPEGNMTCVNCREKCNRFNCFLFMGTSKPVKITDGKTGIIRRLANHVTEQQNRCEYITTNRKKFLKKDKGDKE